jgi:hypothetical protein
VIEYRVGAGADAIAVALGAGGRIEQQLVVDRPADALTP